KITVVNGNGSAGDPTVDFGSVALDDLSDVIITTPNSGEVITYNGTNWVNGTSAGGGGGDPLDPLLNAANSVTFRVDLTGTSLTNAYQYTGTGRAVVTSINISNTSNASEYE